MSRLMRIFIIHILSWMSSCLLGDGLPFDLLSISGLRHFKANNLTNPGCAQAALDDLKKKASIALNNQQPYSVTNSSRSPPNGNEHGYYSWAPYFHANCSGVPHIKDPMTDCPYQRIDGKYATDLRLLTDPRDSGSMVNDVLALSIYYYLYEDEKYATKAVQLLNVWFLDPDTAMRPNIEFGQVVRGPGEWVGRVEGILDMRYYVYIPAAVELLTNSTAVGGSNSQFTKEMKTWFFQYGNWLLTSKLGTGARNAANNHATFYVVQLATYFAWTGQEKKAIILIQEFRDRQFQYQIIKSGEQPLESGRTRSFHYQAFNLIALTYIARLSEKINGAPNFWEQKTKQGATIKTAVDYLVDQGFPKDDPIYFMVPLYSAKQHYGDSTGKYNKFLSKLLQIDIPGDEWWLFWNPLALNDAGSMPPKVGTNRTDDDDIEEDGGGYTPADTNETVKWSSGALSITNSSVLCNYFVWGSLWILILGFIPRL
ncbi:2436_t:CDS:2 [Ambispora gerdemannii]|uniref:2436_t:CDS:1 n=1 Tax=Ambispora gerdemannii TaxID=144530 RepID=A0A9N9FK78_9GLOM|nr:2436_t:CDS:2 [Ambispora gerdemannii]